MPKVLTLEKKKQKKKKNYPISWLTIKKKIEAKDSGYHSYVKSNNYTQVVQIMML